MLTPLLNLPLQVQPPGAARVATILALLCLVFAPLRVAAQTAVLGATNLVEGPAAGADSVVLAATAASQTWTATANATWLHLDASNQGGTGSATVSFTFDDNPGGNRTGTLTIAGQALTVNQAGASFTLSTSCLFEGPAAGGDSAMLMVNAASAPWVATANVPWLHLSPANQRGRGTATVSFSYDANPGGRRGGILTVAGQLLHIYQAAGSPVLAALGTDGLLEGPAAGIDSVVLGVFGSITNWTAAADSPWLHLNQHNDHGAGSTNVVFTFDANFGPTRTGTLTIAGLALAVTQAGAQYVPANLVTGITRSPTYSPLLEDAFGFGQVTSDGAGNSYWCSFALYSGSYQTFNIGPPRNPDSQFLFSTSGAGASPISGLGVDGAGNIYLSPSRYTSDPAFDAILRWSPADGSLATLPCSVAHYSKQDAGLAVDVAGNCYFVYNQFDSNLQFYEIGSTVYKRTASDGTIAELFNLADSDVDGDEISWIVVDGSGNVYFQPVYIGSCSLLGCPDGPQPYKWSVLDGSLSVVAGSPVWQSVWGAVDPAGNVAISFDYGASAMVLPRAFVDPAPITEGANAGNGRLSAVVPATANLTDGFAPSSDQAWLTIAGVTNGVVSYAFTANPSGAARKANLTVLGVTIPLTQTAAAPTSLGWLPGGVFQFTFTGTPGAAYSVLSTTNLSLPVSAWTVAGPAVELAAGQFQFTASPTPGGQQQFFQVRSP